MSDINIVYTPRTIYITVADSPFSGLRTGDTIVCDTSGGVITITLPKLATSGGQEIKIINSGSVSSVTVNASAGDTINGLASQVVLPGNILSILRTPADWLITRLSALI